MGLILIGLYDKKEALEILNNLKYYKRNLEPYSQTKNFKKVWEYIPYIRMCENKMHEDFLIDKMKVIRSVLNKQNNEAINAYSELTSPCENSFISPLINMLDDGSDAGFIEILHDLTIPMKKEEFEHYLDIYNQFIKNTTK